MMYRKSLVFAAASLVAGATASVSKPSDAFALFRRQDPIGPGTQIPEACTATCAPIESTVNTCQDLSCLCTNEVAGQIASCIDCLVGVGGGGSVEQSQSIIDQYTNACITSGDAISSIQVSSVSPTGTGAASSSPTSASSGSASGTDGQVVTITTSSAGASGTSGSGSTTSGALSLSASVFRGAMGAGVMSVAAAVLGFAML